MANTKGTDLAAFASLAATDILVGVDVSGTPTTKKATLTQLWTGYLKGQADTLYSALGHAHATTDITSGTFADARVAETNVTQHQAALSLTESQISDLQTYATAASTTTFTNKTIDGDNNTITNLAIGSEVLATPVADITMGGFNLTGGGMIKLIEQAAADADTPGSGQLWVKTATPNQLWFTDDAGTDFQLASLAGAETLTNKTVDADNNTVTNIGATEIKADLVTGQSAAAAFASGDKFLIVSGGAIEQADFDDLPGAGGGIANVVEDTTPQLGGALDGQGNDLNNMGVLFLTEQAAAEVDVIGKGQLWVETATPNLLKFTDDAGTDFQVATLTGTETLTNKTLTSPVISDIVSVSNGNVTIAPHGTGDILLTSDTVTIEASGKLQFGAIDILTDSAGTTTLNNIDALDATTEATIEAAIDTLANLTSIQGNTFTLAANFITSGANSLTFTTTGTTNVTLPTAGTLAAITGVNAPKESFVIACSDETTALTTGTAKVTFRMPYAFTLTEVRGDVTTAPTGAGITVDVNDSGTTIMTTNKIVIDATEFSSEDAGTAPTITDASLADNAQITIDIDAVGSTIAGTGLKVTLIGYQT